LKGPYFPARVPIPPRFEILQDVEQMPALLKIAKGAVIRAGFNTTWECVAAGTPFIPLIGTTFAEPVGERVDRLAALGLIPPSIERFWTDDAWRAEYRHITANIVARHSGAPNPTELARLIIDRGPPSPIPKRKVGTIRLNSAKQKIPFVIRIDDVVSKEPALCWLLDVLAGQGLRASLEVVPYLMEFDQTFLDRFDPSRALFEVSQHGYAHVPRITDSGRRCEFLLGSSVPSTHELELIERGKRQMETAFPDRFTGGFSPPFDALPTWLPATWRSLSGRFLSCLCTNSGLDASIPVRRAGVDVWDWVAGRALNLDRLTHKLGLQLAVDGHAGIVLHPSCLRGRSDKLRLMKLLGCVVEAASTVSLADLALGKVDVARRYPPSAGLWTMFRGKPSTG
jgi:peptidoglycan/xylan/chitin deacetylase (PgdA/CDA1 family)